MTPTESSRWTRRASQLFDPIDASWLAAFRALFGVLLCISMLRFLAYGWVERLFVTPTFFFKYWGFSWVQPLPAPLLHALFGVLALCALATAIGFCFRPAALLLAVGLGYIQLLDVSTYLNHYYLATLLAALLAVSPAGQVYSLDAWLDRRASGGSLELRRTVPRLWLWLFRFQVGVVYTFAGLAKAQSDWLLHAQPLRVWLGSNAEMPVLGPFLTLDGVPLLMSWCGFLFDSTIVLWLSLRRTRPFAFVVVVIFHLMTRALFPIGMFPAFMIVGALTFFEPTWPRALLSRLRRWAGRGGLASDAAALPDVFDVWLSHGPRKIPPLTRVRQLGLVLAGAYCAWQLVLPLRYVAYGGNVLWHEQGMRFSWRVMVRAKGGSTRFWVTQRETAQRWNVAASDYLTPMQESEMSSQPDLILQLAHHIKSDFERRGLGPVEVRAESRVSLNGRRSVPLIDPTVDLSLHTDGLGLARFVMPAPSDAPPHTRVVP